MPRFSGALDGAIKDGSYAAIFKKWGTASMRRTTN